MTDLTRQHFDLLRDALGTGMYGSTTTRNSLSLYLQGKMTGEVAQLVELKLLEKVISPSVSGDFFYYKATPEGQRIALANPSPRR